MVIVARRGIQSMNECLTHVSTAAQLGSSDRKFIIIIIIIMLIIIITIITIILYPLQSLKIFTNIMIKSF